MIVSTCCSSSNKCEEGEGGCTCNDQCAGDLVCGSGNCGKGWNKSMNCCSKPSTGCNAKKSSWSCCNPSNQCYEGEGDCDKNSDCAGDLVCGKNNCGDAWSNKAYDCCTKA